MDDDALDFGVVVVVTLSNSIVLSRPPVSDYFKAIGLVFGMVREGLRSAN